MQFRQRPESRPDGSRLVDTGAIPADSALTYGLEAAWAGGPFSVQGEYMATSVDVIGGPDADFDGYYVFGSWFVTGESRRYSKGAFSGPKIADANKGAWEVALRYSNVNLNDGLVLGGEMDNITLGVNWYARSGVRFMFNYIAVTSEVAGVDNDPSILQFRTQVSF
jgi:phosphate-selective porin OprO/OprP